MPSEVSASPRKLPVVQLVVAAVVILVAAGLVYRGVDVGALTARAIGMIRQLGPGIFFGAMTVLPAIGVPLSFFTIPAGEAFAPQLGMGGVIAVSLAVVGINLALGYWISRYALRPLLAGLMKRYGYSVPRVTADNALMVTLLVRLTPGPPYAVQACVLGLAEVPFRLYLLVSWLALIPWVVGAIVLGKGLFSGKFGLVVGGIGVLIVAAAAIHWTRRRLLRRRASAGAVAATAPSPEPAGRNVRS